MRTGIRRALFASRFIAFIERQKFAAPTLRRVSLCPNQRHRVDSVAAQKSTTWREKRWALRRCARSDLRRAARTQSPYRCPSRRFACARLPATLQPPSSKNKITTIPRLSSAARTTCTGLFRAQLSQHASPFRKQARHTEVPSFKTDCKVWRGMPRTYKIDAVHIPASGRLHLGRRPDLQISKRLPGDLQRELNFP